MMGTKDNNLFFRLLRLGLGTEDYGGGNPDGMLSDRDFAAEIWKKIYVLGIRQGVGVILLDGLQKAVESGEIAAEMMPPREMKSKWMADCLNLEKICARQYSTAAELAEVYAGHGMRTIVLKGIAAGTCYPNPLHRPCGDLDCFLMGDYEKGNIVAESLGADVILDFYKHSHIRYKGLEVENHQFCTAIRGSRKAKAFERLLQSLLHEEGTTRIGDTCLECPSLMFNALFLTHHSQKHYLSEGIALRHLCDWAMFLKVHGNEMDWGRFKAIATEYGLKEFADSMTRLSFMYLGVDIPASYELPEQDGRDEILFNDIIGYYKVHEYGGKWKTRVALTKSVFSNGYRYRYFSDTTMIADLMKLIGGFILDRKPTLG